MYLKELLAVLSLMFIFGNAQAIPIVYQGTLTSGVTATGDVPLNSSSDSTMWDYWLFYGTIGDVVTITLDRTNDQMDPAFALFLGLGGDTDGLGDGSVGRHSDDGLLTYLTFDDDHGSNIPAGPFNNALLDSFTLAATGAYTIAAFDHLGESRGPWTYGLTVTGAVPEPTTFALLGLGLVGMGFSRKKKNA